MHNDACPYGGGSRNVDWGGSKDPDEGGSRDVCKCMRSSSPMSRGNALIRSMYHHSWMIMYCVGRRACDMMSGCVRNIRCQSQAGYTNYVIGRRCYIGFVLYSVREVRSVCYESVCSMKIRWRTYHDSTDLWNCSLT